ncbi:SDR family NAD(P)-dependent oxidoreductase [Schleiferilactobacillus shenzhenensis]|uniref:Uncharacterized protein n=1 Tax=Schleiferilactobacillus shenzhenensis LY-73 TaxID=1231336 RepID=U4TK98_9LACO|nr:SDR family NAD(P)-dependent oxidoreductase [Schleiferilactobacillus shenzhenensis]ERL63795.1 hypothetical protein L248_2155 [Schleiferilactobacillus shenzhenensis LY-73]
MTTIAIITGASSGLGREYVRAVAEKMPDLGEIWLVARRQERLIALAETIPGQRFRILPYDLTAAASFHKFQGLLAREQPDVRLLINDAGMIRIGNVAAMPAADQEKTVQLNALAPTLLTRLALPYMHRGASIINVTSIGGFTPSPNMVVYSASKAYLLSYSKGLHAELRRRGIHVLALVPGSMRTSQFTGPNAGSRQTGFTVANRLPFLDLPTVTRRSLTIARWGWSVYTPHLFYKAYRVVTALVPDIVLTYVVRP